MGALDEAIYTSVPPISDFIQVEPQEGSPATEKTEVWVSFDDDYVYVSFRCFESDPTRVVPNEMRRDGNNLWQGNDVVGFVFDTFYDRRNAFQFIVSPIGGRMTVRSPTSGNGTATGIPSGKPRPGASRAAGRWKPPCRSNR
jgi:hypothetical protein